MPKNIDGVSLPERRKSIRNIPIPEGRRRSDVPRPSMSDVREMRSEMSVRPALDGVQKVPVYKVPMTDVPEPARAAQPPRPSKGFTSKRIWLTVLGAIVVLLFAILSIFSGATLAYSPKTAPLTFAGETYSAYKSAGNGFIYSVVKLSGDKGLEVPASGEADVSRKASGTVIVYNDASVEPQKLIENTRFESTDGKVYRIAQAITVPGKKSTGPGSLEVTVYADAPGSSYNIGLTDFTLPGLKGTPRYQTLYARSKTPMAGGFIGKEKAVNAQDLTKAKATLQETIKQELLTKAEAEVPPDFILFPTLSLVTYEDLPQTAATGGAMVNMRGQLFGIMFKRSDLASALSMGKVKLTPTDPVEIASFDSLQVAFAGTPPADLLDLNKIDFTVRGNALLVWRTDEVALKSDMAGRHKDDLPQILNNYPTIKDATATLSPFWKTHFPAKTSDIVIKKLKIQ
jgi:hypothetical protein